MQMGMLLALQETPVVIFSLVVGVWLDRSNLKVLLKGALVIQAFMSAVIGVSLLGAYGSLNLLFLAAFILGTTKLVVDLAVTTYLPILVDKDDLVAANSGLQISMAAERMAGPTIGGLIARLLPFSGFIIAAFGHVFAALLLTRIKSYPSVTADARTNNLLLEIRSGLQLLFNHRLLRPVIASSCLGAYSAGMFYALLILVLIKTMNYSAFQAGLMMSLIGVATMVTAPLTTSISLRIGIGPMMIVGVIASATGMFLFSTHTYAIVGLVSLGVGSSLYSISQISIRQAVTPDGSLGRVNSSRRFIVFAFLPLGSLTSGLIAEGASSQVSMLIAALIMLMSTLPLILTPIRGLKDINQARSLT